MCRKLCEEKGASKKENSASEFFSSSFISNLHVFIPQLLQQ